MTQDGDALLPAIGDKRYDDAIMLVEAGAELNEPSDDGASPLFAAVLSGHLALIETMLRRGADPSFHAVELALAIYAETPLDLAKQARFLLDWDTFHAVVELLRRHGAKDAEGNADEPPHLAEVEARARAWQRTRPARGG